MKSSEVSNPEHGESPNLFGILICAMLITWTAVSIIPEWPIVYYKIDKGIVEGCMYVMVPKDGNVRTKLACENFIPIELRRMGGYAQK